MKKMKIVAIIVALAATAMITLTACGDKDKIIGTWTNSDLYGATTEFISDGTVKVMGIDAGVWEIKGGKLVITNSLTDTTSEFDYKLEGNKLTFNGNTYEKQE